MSHSLEQIIDAPYENLYKRKTVTMDKSILKDVLTFPEETNHLKYFENNPHPDKISDEILAYSELFDRKDLNGDWRQKKHDFEMVKNLLWPNLSEKERLIMRLPEKIQLVVNAGATGDLLKASTHLRNCFYSYFSTPLDKNIEPDIH